MNDSENIVVTPLSEEEIQELVKEAKEQKNQYNREWRKNNKEKVKAINQRYWIKKAQKLREEKNNNE